MPTSERALRPESDQTRVTSLHTVMADHGRGAVSWASRNSFPVERPRRAAAGDKTRRCLLYAPCAVPAGVQGAEPVFVLFNTDRPARGQGTGTRRTASILNLDGTRVSPGKHCKY